eukprot:6177288-Prymnesium_polylepis.1
MFSSDHVFKARDYRRVCWHSLSVSCGPLVPMRSITLRARTKVAHFLPFLGDFGETFLELLNLTIAVIQFWACFGFYVRSGRTPCDNHPSPCKPHTSTAVPTQYRSPTSIAAT